MRSPPASRSRRRSLPGGRTGGTAFDRAASVPGELATLELEIDPLVERCLDGPIAIVPGHLGRIPTTEQGRWLPALEPFRPASLPHRRGEGSRALEEHGAELDGVFLVRFA